MSEREASTYLKAVSIRLHIIITTLLKEYSTYFTQILAATQFCTPQFYGMAEVRNLPSPTAPSC